jgi:hypothetical protein
VAVTSGLLNLMSRHELEGVLAHEMSHVRNRDIQVSTLAVTTVGVLVAVAEISARGSFFANWGDNDDSGGAGALIVVAILAGILAFGARMLSFAISRHREELADTSAVAIVSPDGLRKALEKLEADHTVTHHVARATAHMWIVTPLELGGKTRKAKTNQLFDTHPPLAERIAILRRLEGLDPNGRGPVDATITGVPVDLKQLYESADRRNQTITPADHADAQEVARAALATNPGWVAKDTVAAPVGKPPGWYHVNETTLRYWQGDTWTTWTATWNGKRWVQARTEET